MEFAPHQQRVVEERDQLAEKIAKLEAFLTGAVIKTLDAEEKVRLILQSYVMGQYLDILNDRIDNFT